MKERLNTTFSDSGSSASLTTESISMSGKAMESESHTPVFSTFSGQAEDPDPCLPISPPRRIPVPENVIAEIECVVTEKNRDFISLKIPSGEILGFPNAALGDAIGCPIGQHLLYQIKIDKNGYRYQQFIPKEGRQSSDFVQKISELLGK